VFEKQEEIPLRLTPEQYKANERRHVAFQDVLPLIAGDHRLFFLLKNKAGKDFTSFEARVSIPKKDNTVRLSSLLLFHGRKKNPDAARGTLKAFNFENYEYLFNTRNEFLNQETMGCYFQVWPVNRADENLPDSLLLEIRSLDGNAVVFTQKRTRQEIVDAAGEIVIEPVPLSAFKPGYYSVEVSLAGYGGRKLGSGRDNFIILAKPYPVLSLPLAKVHKEFPDPEYYCTLGSQYFSLRDYPNAKEMFEEAFVLKDQPSTRLFLGKALYALGDYRESLAAVVPAYEATGDREAAKVIALDYAGLKDWASAVGYLEKLMAEATEVGVLNLAAECYLNLNQPEKALPLLQKSLSLVPSQPEAKALEARAKKLMEKAPDR
jgi:tetratricopeptide (TPR) repeat protein